MHSLHQQQMEMNGHPVTLLTALKKVKDLFTCTNFCTHIL